MQPIPHLYTLRRNSERNTESLSQSINQSPETAPSDPVLADILHIRRLRKELINLVADIQLLVRLEVLARQLLLDSGEHLQRAGVLRFPCFRRHAFLGVENAAFEDRRAAVTGVGTRLDAVLEVHARLARLPAFRGEWHSVWRFANTQAPVDQGVVDELEELACVPSWVRKVTYRFQHGHQ